VSTIKFAKIYRFVFSDILLTRIDCTQTDRHTDTTEYIVSRTLTADKKWRWQLLW